MNWEKLRSPARATIKNPKISLLIGKNWEVQFKTKIQKSQFWIYRWTVKSYVLILSYTVENEMGNIHKAGHISTYHDEWEFPSPQIQELFNKLWKICFPFGKMEFWTHWKFCAFHRVFGLRKGPTNTLTPFFSKC